MHFGCTKILQSAFSDHKFRFVSFLDSIWFMVLCQSWILAASPIKVFGGYCPKCPVALPMVFLCLYMFHSDNALTPLIDNGKDILPANIPSQHSKRFALETFHSHMTVICHSKC